MRDIHRVLSGKGSYDQLNERAQAIVRANWDEQAAASAASLNLAEEFTRSGRTWTEGDEQGRPVTHDPAASAQRTTK